MAHNELRETINLNDQKNEITNLIDQKKEAIKNEADQNKKNILTKEIEELKKAQKLLDTMSKILTIEGLTEATKKDFVLAVKNGLTYIKTKYKITLPDDIEKAITSHSSQSTAKQPQYSQSTQDKLNTSSPEYDEYYQVRQADASKAWVTKNMTDNEKTSFSRIFGPLHFDQDPLNAKFRHGRVALLRLGITKEGERGIDNTLDLFKDGRYLARKMEPLLNYLTTYGLSSESASYTDKNTNKTYELKVQQALKTLKSYLKKDVQEIQQASKQRIRTTKKQLQTLEENLQETNQKIKDAETKKNNLTPHDRQKNEMLYNQIVSLNKTKNSIKNNIDHLRSKLSNQQISHQLLLDQIQQFENDLTTAQTLMRIGNKEKLASLQKDSGPQALDSALTIATHIEDSLKKKNN